MQLGAVSGSCLSAPGYLYNSKSTQFQKQSAVTSSIRSRYVTAGSRFHKRIHLPHKACP
jgi:hypothetical protein